MNGFLPYLLLQARDVQKGAYPGAKITPPGYLRYLLENAKPNIISQGRADGSGHIRDVKIAYAPRMPLGKTQTEDNCEINAIPGELEADIPVLNYRKFALYLPDETVAKYEKEASSRVKEVNGVSQWQGSTMIMDKFWQRIIEAANGLLGDINNDLLALQTIKFGVNQTTGSNAVKAVNFPLSTATNDLTNGYTSLIADANLNEMQLANTHFVGHGLLFNYYAQQIAKQNAQNGVNTSLFDMPKMYPDIYSQTAWGANQFGIFEKNAVQLVTQNKFTGFKQGDRGNSLFGILTLPVVDSDGNLISYDFDCQIKYIDCPMPYNLNGVSTNIDRGFIVILSSNYMQFNVPADAYDSSDRLFGNNGTLRYQATNV